MHGLNGKCFMNASMQNGFESQVLLFDVHMAKTKQNPLGLFQKLSRCRPPFFRQLHPLDTHGVRDLLPSGQICELDPPHQDISVVNLAPTQQP